MHKATGLRIGAVLAVLAMILVLGCTSGVAQKDYDAVKAQLTTAQQQATTAQQQLATKEQEVAALQKRLGSGEGTGTGPAATALREQLAAKEKEIADLKLSLTQAQQKNPYIWTELKPLPPPAPTATPRPPGYVAPTPVPPDAATVNEVFPFTYAVETLTGHQVSGIVQSPLCVYSSQFRRGTHLVWRFEVFDTSTAKRLTSLDSPTVKLVLENGQELTARFARKAGTGPWTWVTAWDVPADYPLGEINYTIVVQSKDGRTGTYDPNKAALVNKDRGIDQRLQVVE